MGITEVVARKHKMSRIYGGTEYGCKIYTACNGGKDDIDLHNLISKLITSIEATGVRGYGG